MSGGYVLIAGILLYIFLFQKVDSASMTPLRASLFFILCYHLLSSITIGIQYASWGLPLLPNLLSIGLVVTATVQFAITAVIFHKAEESNDEYLSYALWGGVGLALIFFVVPHTVQWFFAIL